MGAVLSATFTFDPLAELALGLGSIRVPVDQSKTSAPVANTTIGSGEMSDTTAVAKLHAAAQTTVLSEDQIRQHVAGALEDIGGTAKQIAREANTTPVAVKNWLLQRNTMSLSAFAQLARQNPRFQQFAAYLIGLEADVLKHNEWQREVARFKRLLAEMDGGAP